MTKEHAALLLSAIAVVLATPASAEASSSAAGFFWSAVVVLGGPALGGLAVCGAMIGWRWMTSRAPWAVRLMASWRWSSRAKVFARADIASILVPLIDCAGFPPGSTIQMVGSDGGYLTGTKKRRLTDAIRKWVREGHRFRYILVAPSEKAVAELERLREQISREDEASSERFEVLQLGGKPAASPTKTPADIELLEKVLCTSHPTLIWSEDGVDKAMWIEGNHPRGEDVSYNNQWVPPPAMGEAVADFPNQTWSDVFATWEGKLAHLSEYMREQAAAQ